MSSRISRSISRIAAAIAFGGALHLGLALADPVANVPNGVVDGRPDAKYGTYTTVVGTQAQPYQKRLLDLQNRAYGLALLSHQDFVVQAEAGYALENSILALYRDIANAPGDAMSDFDRQSLLYGTTKVYGDVRQNAERIYENMVRYVDKKLPGPNGKQIRMDVPYSDAHQSLYYPNYRSDSDLTAQERQKLYEQKLDEFLKKGGSLSEIHVLTPEFFASLPEYSRFEYVWMPNGEIRVTPGEAGHLLLAKGGAVAAAGQIIFVKGSAAGSTLMIVSNSSGNYKPDLLSAQDLAQALQAQLGIQANLSLVTKGEPMSTQAVKVFMKADGASPDAIGAELKKLEQLPSLNDEVIAPDPGNVPLALCGSVFS